MACGFVYIDGVDIPAVTDVILTPAYVTDAQRTLAGVLRVEHTAAPKEWRIELRDVTGAELNTLLPHLALVSPREVIVMGTATTAAVFIDQVQFKPKVTAPQDLRRANVTLTIREMLAHTPPQQIETPTADNTSATADTTGVTADAA